MAWEFSNLHSNFLLGVLDRILSLLRGVEGPASILFVGVFLLDTGDATVATVLVGVIFRLKDSDFISFSGSTILASSTIKVYYSSVALLKSLVVFGAILKWRLRY